MNKEQFYREDYENFKQKYFLFCREKQFKLEKFGSYVKKPYICRIKIEEL